MIGASNARIFEEPNYYQSWGHSSFINPLGKVLQSCEQKPAILYGEVDYDFLDETRKALPYQHQKRDDVYKVENLTSK